MKLYKFAHGFNWVLCLLFGFLGHTDGSILALLWSVMFWLIWKEKQVEKLSKDLVLIKVGRDGQPDKVFYQGREIKVEYTEE